MNSSKAQAEVGRAVETPTKTPAPGTEELEAFTSAGPTVTLSGVIREHWPALQWSHPQGWGMHSTPMIHCFPFLSLVSSLKCPHPNSSLSQHLNSTCPLCLTQCPLLLPEAFRSFSSFPCLPAGWLEAMWPLLPLKGDWKCPVLPPG